MSFETIFQVVFSVFAGLLILVILTHCYLQIPHLRPAEYKRSRLSRNRRTVNRAYGGVLSGGAVRERFVVLEIYVFDHLFDGFTFATFLSLFQLLMVSW